MKGAAEDNHIFRLAGWGKNKYPMNASELITDRGVIIGLGRVKIPKMPTLDFNYEIPLHSFIVTEVSGHVGYVATCIHLQTDGYGATKELAIDDMLNNVWYFLHENFNGVENVDEAWANLLDLFKSCPQTNVLWDKYHALQILSAEQGINTDTHSTLHTRIVQLEQKVRDLESKITDKDDFIARLLDDYLSKVMAEAIVEYKEGRPECIQQTQ